MKRILKIALIAVPSCCVLSVAGAMLAPSSPTTRPSSLAATSIPTVAATPIPATYTPIPSTATLRPTAEPSLTPLPTATLPPAAASATQAAAQTLEDEQDYLLFLTGHNRTLAGNIAQIQLLAQTAGEDIGQVSKAYWRTSMDSELQSLKTSAQSIREMDVPKRFTASYRSWLKVAATLDKLSSALRAGVDNLDGGKLNEAAGHMVTLKTQMEEANRLTDLAKAQ